MFFIFSPRIWTHPTFTNDFSTLHLHGLAPTRVASSPSKHGKHRGAQCGSNPMAKAAHGWWDSKSKVCRVPKRLGEVSLVWKGREWCNLQLASGLPKTQAFRSHPCKFWPKKVVDFENNNHANDVHGRHFFPVSYWKKNECSILKKLNGPSKISFQFRDEVFSR